MAKKKSFVLKAKHKSKKGGLTAEGRRAYNRATGSNLKRPQPEGGSRKKSYCARSKGQMKDHDIDCSKTPDKRICLARRRWKCNKSLQKSDIPPKAKLAAFLRDHIDNKLALKAAEPTITKSGKLEKGAKGDWKKEGYKIKYKALPNNEHEITAHTKTGEIVGSAYLLEHSPYEITAADVNVDEDHRRKGLASAMYELAEKKTGKKMVSASEVASQQRGWDEEETFSSDAEKLWLQPKRKFGKSQNADKTGMSALMKALKQCACKKSDKLAGGKGDTKDISDFDAKEVEMGLKVEMEHTKDREVAQEIVADHLSEDPSYYSKLKGSGLADELKKAISPEQQKENIRKQRELQNRQVVQTLKPQKRLGNAICPVCDSPMDSSEGMAHADCFDEFEDYDEFENFIKQKKQQEAKKPTSIPSPKLLVSKEDSLYNIPIYLKTHPNHDNLVGKHLHFDEISHNNVLEQPEVQNALYEAESRGESPITKIYVSADKVNEPSKPSSHLRVVKSLEKAGRCWEGYEPTPSKKPYSKGSCRKIKKSITAEAIEAGQYQGEQLDSHHHNRLGVEYKGMAQKAHKMGDKKKARDFHDKALHHFKMADKMGFQQEEPLEKKISGKVAAGLTALSGIVSSPTATTAAKPPQTEAPKPIIPQEKYFDLKNELSAKTIQNMFLHNISQLESSGGKNKNHPVIKDPKSIHYGMKAVGNFAMMPLTIQEIANRHAHNGGKDPRILKIQKMNPHTGEINKYIEANPELEMDLARNLATHVLNKHGYTPEAAFSWKYGHNLSPQQIKEPDRQEKMKSDTYVQEFKQLQQGGSPKGLVPAINRNIN